MRWTKPWKQGYYRGVGLVDLTPGMSFQPFDIHHILGRAWFWFVILFVFPMLAVAAITVLQSVFPWWPR